MRVPAASREVTRYEDCFAVPPPMRRVRGARGLSGGGARRAEASVHSRSAMPWGAAARDCCKRCESRLQAWLRVLVCCFARYVLVGWIEAQANHFGRRMRLSGARPLSVVTASRWLCQSGLCPLVPVRLQVEHALPLVGLLRVHLLRAVLDSPRAALDRWRSRILVSRPAAADAGTYGTSTSRASLSPRKCTASQPPCRPCARQRWWPGS